MGNLAVTGCVTGDGLVPVICGFRGATVGVSPYCFASRRNVAGANMNPRLADSVSV